MKKRKIFVGLLLGAAAFGLAACTTGGNSTTSGENTPSTTQGVTPTTSNTTPSGDNTQSTPTAQKYTVKYYAVVGDEDAVEVTAAAQEVEEGKTTTAPEAKLAKDGYKIAGYFTNEGCGEEFKFTTTITKNTKVYVKYETLSTYDTLAASTNKVLAYDFSTATTLTEGNEFGATTPTLLTNDTTNVKVENGAVSLAKNNFLVDFGKTLGTGVINAYFEVTFKAVKTKEAWLQLTGDSYTKTSTEVLALRTDGSSKLAYRVDGDADITNANSPTITQNSTYKILMTIDTAEQTLTLKVDDTVIYENVAITANSFKGLKFTAKSDGTSSKVIDNVAVTFETKQTGALVAAKNEVIGLIDTYKASTAYTELDTAVKTAIDNKIATFKKNVSDAADADAVATVKTAWNTFVAADKYYVPVKAYTAANTAAEGVADAKMVIIEGTDAEKTAVLAAVSFDGYDLGDIYSDAGLTTKATIADVANGKTLYAAVTKQGEKTKYEFKAADLTSTTDNEKIAAGELKVGTDNAFTIVSDGNATYRVKESAVYAIELGKKFTSYIKVTLRDAATITVYAGSTNGTNKTTGFGVYTDTAGTTLAKDVTAVDVTGNGSAPGQKLEFAIAAAGTYYIGYTESARGGRIFSITIDYSK